MEENYTTMDLANMILAEKTNKITPENIKQDVQIFDVVGTYKGDTNTLYSPQRIQFTGIGLPYVSNVYQPFYPGDNLDMFDVAHLDTSNVNTLNYTFYFTQSLTTLRGLENWDTRNLKDMNNAFSGMTKLSNVNELSNWNVSNVVSMYNTFAYCNLLSDISGLSNWNPSNLTSMNGTFYNCGNLRNLNGLSNWNTSNLISMNNVFVNCSNLTNLNGLANWNTSNLRSMARTFHNCVSLSDISELSNWDTSNLTSMEGTFTFCTSITDLSVLDNWDFNNKYFYETFFGDIPNCNLGTHNVNNSKFTNAFPFSADFSSLDNWYFTNCIIEGLCGTPYRNINLNSTIRGDHLYVRLINQSYSSGDMHVLSSGNLIANDIDISYFMSNCRDFTTVNGMNLTNCKGSFMAFYQCYNLTNINNMNIHFSTTGSSLSLVNMFGFCYNLADATCMENWAFTHRSSSSQYIYTNNIFSYCNNLSDDSLYAATNFFLKISDYLSYNSKNLRNTERNGPFYQSNINCNARLNADQKDRLIAAGFVL